MTTVARICSVCGKLHRREEPEFFNCRKEADPALNVIKDVEPHWSPATDSIVTSRSQIREGMKKHNLVEVGNEMSPRMRERAYEQKHRA